MGSWKSSLALCESTTHRKFTLRELAICDLRVTKYIYMSDGGLILTMKYVHYMLVVLVCWSGKRKRKFRTGALLLGGCIVGGNRKLLYINQGTKNTVIAQFKTLFKGIFFKTF